MPGTHFITIKNQPYEVNPTSDFYFNKVTRVIASFTQGVDVRSLNECAEAVKTAIIPSLPGRIVAYNNITETYYWNVSEDEISDILLQLYEINLIIDIETLQENGASQEVMEAAQDKLARYRKARQTDAENEVAENNESTNESVVTTGQIEDALKEVESLPEDQRLKEMQKRFAAQE
ncbi:MAG TPA: hypothetical protein VIQ31_38605 [Phormidium sp.]